MWVVLGPRWCSSHRQGSAQTTHSVTANKLGAHGSVSRERRARGVAQALSTTAANAESVAHRAEHSYTSRTHRPNLPTAPIQHVGPALTLWFDPAHGCDCPTTNRHAPRASMAVTGSQLEQVAERSPPCGPRRKACTGCGARGAWRVRRRVMKWRAEGVHVRTWRRATYLLTLALYKR